jgi:coenzyme F420-reducing hydrogenase delta subunit
LKTILKQFGFEDQRVRLTWIGASDGHKLSETIDRVVAQVKALGPVETKTTMVI